MITKILNLLTFLRSLAQAGQPAPWAKPFRNQRSAHSAGFSVREKSRVLPPLAARPAGTRNTSVTLALTCYCVYGYDRKWEWREGKCRQSCPKLVVGRVVGDSTEAGDKSLKALFSHVVLRTLLQ